MTTRTDPRCVALAKKQLRIYLRLRRKKLSLLDGRHYKPAVSHIAAEKPAELPPCSNVQPLIRKKER